MIQKIRHKAVICLLSFITISLNAEPWGKDADLIHNSCLPKAEIRCKTPILGPFSEVMIGFHQNIISPADGPRSHFYPSSSQYTLDAMRKYGFMKGYFMGCDRLMRENSDPWVYRQTFNPKKRCMMKSNPVR